MDSLGVGSCNASAAAASLAKVFVFTNLISAKDGFCSIDVAPDKITFQLFTWRPPQLVDEIATMKPALVYEVARRA